MKQAACIGRKELISFGTCLGKFTKSQKFFLHITALDYLAPYAKVCFYLSLLINRIKFQWRVWLKPTAEQQFLYGNNILKNGVGRMSEGTESKQGVIVYNMNDMPLGFGIIAKSTAEIRHSDPTAICVLHQGDLGAYLRDEDSGL